MDMPKKQKSAIRLTPDQSLNVLSQIEVERLASKTDVDVSECFRRCALAVLNTGSETDNTKTILDAFHDFSIKIITQERGIKIEIANAPASAFVDDKVIEGIREHVFSVLRDIVYINNELQANTDIDLNSSQGITNGVFHIVRNAGLLKENSALNLIVCWGGHSIREHEYHYTKEVGYQMGMRGLDICTGCGPGAMKGPMKGATFGHAKQRIKGRYVGITEPGIIAAESPNPIVNQLIIMPDIEKRLEAFVRTGHGIIVFPGGAGTAEEILYILGILLHPENANVPFPLVFTGPESSRDYFVEIDTFIAHTLGDRARQLYTIIIDDPVAVARHMKEQIDVVRHYRRQMQDAYYFNWVLKIDHDLQQPFLPSHENMATLDLHKNQAPHILAANLRRAFSGIVDGNVKEHGIQAVAEKGPYEIHGDTDILLPMGKLLQGFVDQKRMKIPTEDYVPCYRIVDE